MKFCLQMTKELSPECDAYEIMKTYERLCEILKSTEHCPSVEISIYISRNEEDTSGEELPF